MGWVWFFCGMTVGGCCSLLLLCCLSVHQGRV